MEYYEQKFQTLNFKKGGKWDLEKNMFYLIWFNFRKYYFCKGWMNTSIDGMKSLIQWKWAIFGILHKNYKTCFFGWEWVITNITNTIYFNVNYIIFTSQWLHKLVSIKVVWARFSIPVQKKGETMCLKTWIQVLNCQNCDQYLKGHMGVFSRKGHKSPGLLLKGVLQGR